MNSLHLPKTPFQNCKHLLERAYFGLASIEENTQELAADYYVAHMSESLFAARLLKSRHGGKIVLDQVEVPEIYYRNHRSLSKRKRFLDYYYEFSASSEITSEVQTLTIGNSMKEYLENKYKIRSCTVVENYPEPKKIVRHIDIRKHLNVPQDCKLILYPNNITQSSNFERVIEWVKQLPDNVYLFQMGRIPEPLRKKLDEHAKKLGVSDRVKYLGFIDYEEYQNYAHEANFALIYLNDRVLNNKLALPNRIFDSIRSELPVFSYDAPDIRKYIMDYGVGDTFRNSEYDEQIVNSIVDFLNKSNKYKENAKKAAMCLVWEKQEEKLLKILPPNSTVTFLGLRNLYRNNRTLRMAKTLANNGCHVKIFAVGDPTIPSPHEKI